MPPGGGGNTHEVSAHLKKCCEARASDGELLTDGSNGCQWIAIPGQRSVHPEARSLRTDDILRRHQNLDGGRQDPASLRNREDHEP